MTDSHDLGGRVDAGKDVNTLIAETGFSRKILDEYAKLAGFTFVRTKAKERIRIPRARNGDRIDRAWLREQAGTLLRANTTSAPSSACVAKRSAATGATTEFQAAPADQTATSSPTCTTPTCPVTSAAPSKDNATAGNVCDASSRSWPTPA